MDSMQQFAQIVAVATPILTLVALNAALLLAGETGTLLLPGMRSYPPIPLAEAPVQAVPVLEEAPEELRLAA
jgi:hypothetical protein